MQGAQASLLPDGRRLHLHHGPIDLIIEVWGAGREDAYRRATSRFAFVLSELVSELPALRSRGQTERTFAGPIARRMQAAIAPYCDHFVTPMASVAGAVADDILQHIGGGAGIDKAYVNNGGDIAVHLGAGCSMTMALASVPGGRAVLRSDDAYRGIATSGWRGRSLSLGIADSVTVVARDAACADVAATLIANAVDLPGCAAVVRAPAQDIFPDSDLGERLVTTDVGELSAGQVRQALDRGKVFALDLLERRLIGGACLQLCNVVEDVGSFGSDFLEQSLGRPHRAIAHSQQGYH